jgi:hypothetical protein
LRVRVRQTFAKGDLKHVVDNPCDSVGALALRIHRPRRWEFNSLAAARSASDSRYQPGFWSTTRRLDQRNAQVKHRFEVDLRIGFLRSPSGNTSGPQQATLLQQWRGVAV